ncbi:MAG: hypothetical protein AB9834_03210 [Lentimicrobium sp.]
MLTFGNAMLKLKIFFFPAFFLLIASFSIVKGQQGNPDSLLIEERAYYYNKYRSVRDTMTVNTWLNLKRVSDNLEQVVKRDQLVIDGLKQKILSDSVMIVDLKKLPEPGESLSAQNANSAARNKSDVVAIIYLKATVAVLLFVCLILVYFLISRVGIFKKLRSSIDQYANKAEEIIQQLELAEAELRRVKQRELDFREELERGMQLNQERLLSLQEKCGQLEFENQQLRSKRKNSSEISPDSHPDISVISELPDNIEELKQMTKSLLDERNSLMNLAGALRSKYEEETRKHHGIIEKISFLLNDLSENKAD